VGRSRYVHAVESTATRSQLTPRESERARSLPGDIRSGRASVVPASARQTAASPWRKQKCRAQPHGPLPVVQLGRLERAVSHARSCKKALLRGSVMQAHRRDSRPYVLSWRLGREPDPRSPSKCTPMRVSSYAAARSSRFRRTPRADPCSASRKSQLRRLQLCHLPFSGVVAHFRRNLRELLTQNS
jgi:hypothetical protein